MSIKERTWTIVAVAASKEDKASHYFDIGIIVLIFLNVLAVIVESIPAMQAHYAVFFHRFEVFSIAVFSIEYLARIWSCTASADLTEQTRLQAFLYRIRYALRPMSLIDLIAILPFYLSFFGADLRSLRALRLLRLVRILKLGRYVRSLGQVRDVLIAKREELVLTTVVMGLLLIISSTILYYCENSAQPEAFSSIPATMWWAIATLTTVAYGDMYPITTLGKFFSGIIAVLGVGMFALPTGILGAGFVEGINRSKSEPAICPHCGKNIA